MRDRLQELSISRRMTVFKRVQDYLLESDHSLSKVGPVLMERSLTMKT
jgi:hypothetical protein